MAVQKNRENRGAFDLTVEGKVDSRVKGYYDGDFQGIKVIKPLQFLNSKVYTGYRLSEGDFPSYEGKMDTLDRGEVSAGLELSLWRDSMIDSKRFKLWNSLLDLENAKQKQKLTAMKFESQAIKTYWQWVVMGRILNVQRNLLDIAIKRNSALVKRSQRGDIAAIYVTENNQYIVKRRADVLKAKQFFEQASYDLSLFYRDLEGDPLKPILEQVPFELPLLQAKDLAKEEMKLNSIINKNPQVKIIEQKIAQQRNAEALGANSLKPKFDLNLEVTEDRGDGSSTLEQQEVRGVMSISIPIERNLGEGAKQAARAKIRGLEQELQFIKQYTKVNLDRLIIQINMARDIVANASEEIRLAQILEEAEHKKFKRGASDFFVINLREQNTADAKIKKEKAFLKYQKAYAEYLFLMLALSSERT